ncbi:MAG: hypothetical protein IIA44_09075 [Acidobacteria bacterium]|nr:hypothetical protein [Acidobacteriota bacterium]
MSTSLRADLPGQCDRIYTGPDLKDLAHRAQLPSILHGVNQSLPWGLMYRLEGMAAGRSTMAMTPPWAIVYGDRAQRAFQRRGAVVVWRDRAGIQCGGFLVSLSSLGAFIRRASVGNLAAIRCR